MLVPNPRFDMPSLLYPGRKPTGNVVLDTNHPVVKNMVGYWLMDEYDALPVDLVTGKKSSKIGTTTQIWEPNYIITRSGTDSAGINLHSTQPEIVRGSDYVWAIRIRRGTSPNGWETIFGNRYDGGATSFVKLTPNKFEYFNSGEVSNSFSIPEVDDFRTYIVRKVGSEFSWFVDGVLTSSFTDATDEMPANPVYLGCGSSIGQEAITVYAEFAFHGPISLSDEQCVDISNDPYQFLIPA